MKKLEFSRKMYRIMAIGNDPDEVIWSDEEMQMFNEQKRLMIAQAGQLPQMPGMSGIPEQGMKPSNPGSPVAGNVPGPSNGMPRPAMAPRGPGAANIDFNGRPM